MFVFYLAEAEADDYDLIFSYIEANLRALIAYTGIVILLKLDSNHKFFAQITLQFDGWSRQIIGHLFYSVSSFVHHFISIGEFKLESQSGNTWFISKLVIFVLRDLEIWQMTLKNIRAPFLCYFKLSASFHSHHWIQTRVTVRKSQIWVKIGYFCPMSHWKTIWHHFYATSSFVHHFIAIGQFKLNLPSSNAQFG